MLTAHYGIQYCWSFAHGKERFLAFDKKYGYVRQNGDLHMNYWLQNPWETQPCIHWQYLSKLEMEQIVLKTHIPIAVRRKPK